jgi:enamine deaminase RidA (YjgF/YER057c/UK114 family)
MTIERIPSSFASFSETVSVSGPGTWIQIAGQVGFNEAGDGVVDGGVGPQSQVIFDQIEGLLAKSGADLSHVVKLNVFMTDLGEYGEFSAVRTERFPADPPASAAVGVADLLLGAAIEIDGVAFLPDAG